jgi:hypothetical protein
VVPVPLVNRGDTIGVLNCYTDTPHDSSPGEMALLETIADQAAIAITAAQLRVRKRAQIADLERQRALLERADEIDADLTRVVLRNACLEPIVAALGPPAELSGPHRRRRPPDARRKWRGRGRRHTRNRAGPPWRRTARPAAGHRAGNGGWGGLLVGTDSHRLGAGGRRHRRGGKRPPWTARVAGARAEPHDVAQQIRRTAQRRSPGTGLSVVIGPTAERLTDLVQAAGGRDRVVSLDQLGVYGLLLQMEQPDVVLRFTRTLLARLEACDRQRAGELVHTLRVYLARNCNVGETADALVVHPPIPTYRLHRIEELLGINLRQPRSLPRVQLAFMVQEIGGGACAAA